MLTMLFTNVIFVSHLAFGVFVLKEKKYYRMLLDASSVLYLF